MKTENGGLEAVLEHLMFHRALIDEGNGHERLDRYLGMAQVARNGIEMAPKDPMERNLQLVFELVMSSDFDPWDIDLARFTDMYMRKLANSEVNFIVAGKLVFMAWSILKLQSEEVLRSHEEKPELFCADWDFDALEQICPPEENDAGIEADVPESIDLCEAVRHQALRPVSLVELLDALDQANQEAAAQEARLRLREQQRLADQHFDGRSHAEDLEKDVEEVWRRIVKCGQGPITIEDLCVGGREDRITVFISLLFLARDCKIALWQDDLPFGQIFMEMKLPWDIGTLEDAKPVAEVSAPQTVM
jgi:segregation and condensation protein A